MSSLLPETFFHISPFCTLQDVGALSSVSRHYRDSFGMVKLNELYNNILERFKKLHLDFEFRCKPVDSDPNKIKNVYVVTLYNLHFEAHSANPFQPVVDVASLLEPNKIVYRLKESLSLEILKCHQFYITARLGHPIYCKLRTSSTPYHRARSKTQFFYNTLSNVKYPIEEIRYFFSKESTISPFEMATIAKAAKNALLI